LVERLLGRHHRAVLAPKRRAPFIRGGLLSATRPQKAPQGHEAWAVATAPAGTGGPDEAVQGALLARRPHHPRRRQDHPRRPPHHPHPRRHHPRRNPRRRLPPDARRVHAPKRSRPHRPLAGHTSMSVADALEEPDGTLHICQNLGWKTIPPASHPTKTEELRAALTAGEQSGDAGELD